MKKILLIRDFKSRRQLESGRDLVGLHGKLIREAVHQAKHKIADIQFLYLFNEMPSKENLSRSAFLEAAEALKAEVRAYPEASILVLGDKAYEALTDRKSPTNWVGGYETWEDRPLMFTHHTRRVINSPDKYLKPYLWHIQRHLFGTSPDKLGSIIYEDDAKILGVLQSLKQAKLVAVDIETHRPETGEDSVDITDIAIDSIGFGHAHGAVAVRWPHPDPAITQCVIDLLRDKDLKKCFHNGQFDTSVLTKLGYEVNGFVFDTLLAHATLEPGAPHDLGSIAAHYLYIPRWKSAYKSGDISRQKYNALDCRVTYLLARVFEPMIQAEERLRRIYREYHTLIDVVVQMKKTGCAVDMDKRAEHHAKLSGLQAAARAEFHERIGVIDLGIGGNNQNLANLFFKTWRCKPISYTETGKPKFDDIFLQYTMETCDEPMKGAAKMLLTYRRQAKLLSTYVDGLPVGRDDAIHPSWNISGAVTGRWSSSEPNFQNIPQKMRDMFVPRRPDLWLVGADFSAIEARIAAILMGAKKLLSWLQDQSVDVHTKNAAEIFGIPEEKVGKKSMYRQCAKTVLYAVFYNFSDDVTAAYNAIREHVPNVSYKDIQYVRKRLVEVVHPEIRAYHIRTRDWVMTKGYVEEPLSGRRRTFDPNWFNINEALNFPIQGMASTIFNRAIRGVWKDIKGVPDETIIAAVHDAIYLEGPNPDRLEAILSKNMVQVIEMNGHRMEFSIETKRGKSLYEL